METTRVFKVIVRCQDKDEAFYTRIHTDVPSLNNINMIMWQRLPRIFDPERVFVKDKSGSEFELKNDLDLELFYVEKDLFEQSIYVEMLAYTHNQLMSTDNTTATPPKRVCVEEQQATPAPSTTETPPTPAPPPKPQDDNAAGQEAHTGVVCDCCDEAIVGFRYKCTECFNFDLCMTCEGKMRHREHVMLRIPSPTLSLYPRPKDLRRQWKKHLETSQAENQSHRHHHGRRHQRRCQKPGNFFDGFFRQLNEESSDPETATAAEAQAGNTGNTTEQPQQQQQQQQGSSQSQVPQNVYPQIPKMVYDFQKLVDVVEAVAGNVSKLFDPMGMANSNFGMPSAATATPTSTPTTEKPDPVSEILIPTKVAVNNEKEKEATAVATAPVEVPIQKNEERIVPIEILAAPTPVVVPSPVPTVAATPKPVIVDVAEEDTADTSGVILPTTDAVPMSPSVSNNSDDAEWMVISNEGMPDTSFDVNKSTQVTPRKEAVPVVASTSAQTNSGPSTQTQGYDELAKELQKDIEEQVRQNLSSAAGTRVSSAPPAPVVYHPVPHINDSIVKMMDMGFSNDGGCLTELMACCNGDIRRALDSLLYRK